MSSQADRSLPRYKQAVRRARIGQLAMAVAAGERVSGSSSPKWSAGVVSPSKAPLGQVPLGGQPDLRLSGGADGHQQVGGAGRDRVPGAGGR
ncbi:hypothetical protein [Streptomyces sp. 900116325]